MKSLTTLLILISNTSADNHEPAPTAGSPPAAINKEKVFKWKLEDEPMDCHFGDCCDDQPCDGDLMCGI